MIIFSRVICLLALLAVCSSRPQTEGVAPERKNENSEEPANRVRVQPAITNDTASAQVSGGRGAPPPNPPLAQAINASKEVDKPLTLMQAPPLPTTVKTAKVDGPSTPNAPLAPPLPGVEESNAGANQQVKEPSSPPPLAVVTDIKNTQVDGGNLVTNRVSHQTTPASEKNENADPNANTEKPRDENSANGIPNSGSRETASPKEKDTPDAQEPMDKSVAPDQAGNEIPPAKEPQSKGSTMVEAPQEKNQGTTKVFKVDDEEPPKEPKAMPDSQKPPTKASTKLPTGERQDSVARPPTDNQAQEEYGYQEKLPEQPGVKDGEANLGVPYPKEDKPDKPSDMDFYDKSFPEEKLDEDNVEGKDKHVFLAGKTIDNKSSHFFTYFLTLMVLSVFFYLLFHNKRKIIAYIIEGSSPRRPRDGPRYSKLDNNLEEAMNSTKGRSSFNTIY